MSAGQVEELRALASVAGVDEWAEAEAYGTLAGAVLRAFADEPAPSPEQTARERWASWRHLREGVSSCTS